MTRWIARLLPCPLIAAVFIGPLQAETLKVEETEFLVTLSDRQGNTVMFRSEIVPLIPYRSCYGWRVRLSGDESLVKFKEIFRLPAEPEIWSAENDEFSTSRIAKDRRTSITERFAVPDDGWIGNSWCVVEGDPEGTYSMDVYVNGEFVKAFDFEVRSQTPD